MGYEFVAGYSSQGIWHESYCRKIKTVRKEHAELYRR